MKTSIVFTVLAAGALTLGACATAGDSRDMTLAERAAQCHGSAQLVPTGRQTGDVRTDYRCRGSHAPRESNTVGAGAARSTAIDRQLAGRIN